MKKIFLVLLGLLTAGYAQAYTSGQANPPAPYNSWEQEFRVVAKSGTAGVSDAIAVGDVLTYDIANNPDGYTVTRVGSINALGSELIACIATSAIATGDTSLHRCLARGFVNNVSFTGATSGIVAGQALCANAAGQATLCGGCRNDGISSPTDCSWGVATANSPITSLQTRGANGTGGGAANNGISVLIKSR